MTKIDTPSVVLVTQSLAGSSYEMPMVEMLIIFIRNNLSLVTFVVQIQL